MPPDEKITSITPNKVEAPGSNWEQGCKRLIGYMPAELQSLASMWLLKAIPEQQENIHVVVGTGDTAISNHPPNDYETPVLKIAHPTEFFDLIAQMTPRILALRSRGLPVLRAKFETDAQCVGAVISNAIQNATPYELEHNLEACIARFVEHLEASEHFPYNPDKPITVGSITIKGAHHTLALINRPSDLGYETPTSMDFAILPDGLQETIDLYNKTLGLMYVFPDKLSPTTFTRAFGLHKVRFGLTAKGVAYVYAVQKARDDFLTHEFSPKKIMDDILQDEDRLRARVLTLRCETEDAGQISPALLKYEEALGLYPTLKQKMADLVRQQKGLDELLYAVDEGLPKVTSEERAYKAAIASGQTEGIYDPESTRFVPRAGYTALVCALATLQKIGIREVKIPTFMPVRWYAHLINEEKYSAGDTNRIQYATSNVLTRMALRATEQVEGIELQDLGEFPETEFTLTLKLDDHLTSKNPMLESILRAVEKTEETLL